MDGKQVKVRQFRAQLTPMPNGMTHLYYVSATMSDQLEPGASVPDYFPLAGSRSNAALGTASFAKRETHHCMRAPVFEGAPCENALNHT